MYAGAPFKCTMYARAPSKCMVYAGAPSKCITSFMLPSHECGVSSSAMAASVRLVSSAWNSARSVIDTSSQRARGDTPKSHPTPDWVIGLGKSGVSASSPFVIDGSDLIAPTCCSGCRAETTLLPAPSHEEDLVYDEDDSTTICSPTISCKYSARDWTVDKAESVKRTAMEDKELV